jgi:hypothetical protein
MKKCAKCKINDRFSNYNSYCRPCKSGIDLKLYHKNPTKRSNYLKEYKENNPEYVEKGKQRAKEWRKKNPKYIEKWMNNKFKTDINYYLKHRINTSILNYLNNKNNKVIDYLGCSIDDFKIHLESLFTEGMTWDNRGKFGWHIDHIQPANTFDLSKEEEIKKCWHYTNLRPLWWQDNLKRPKNGSDVR